MDTSPDMVHQAGSATKRPAITKLRLDVEETLHPRDPAGGDRQTQQRQLYSQGKSRSTVTRSPGKRASEGSSSRLTERALNRSGSDNSRVLHTAEWLDDLRSHYGRPSGVAEPENWPPRATPPAATAAGSAAKRRPSDAAVLAAALAARLQASPLDQPLPSPAQHGSRSSTAGPPGGRALNRSPQRRYSSPAIPRSSGHRTTPAALSEVPLTPPRPLGPKPDRIARRRSASTVSPATGSQGRPISIRTNMAGSRATSDLSLVEKAVVVGVGTLLYPFMRTPSSSGGVTATQSASATQTASADQPPAAAQQSTPAPVSNLDARLTDAAASPSRVADVFAATATFTPPQSPCRQPQDVAAGSGRASAAPALQQLNGESSTPDAQSPLRTPPPLRQAAPSPISLLGGFGKQELMAITPSGGLTEPIVPMASSAGDSTGGGTLSTPLANGDGTPYRTLRETYGSIPAANSAGRKAVDASIACAVAQLAAADAALTNMPAASGTGDVGAGWDSACAASEPGAASTPSSAPTPVPHPSGDVSAASSQIAADGSSAEQRDANPAVPPAPQPVSAPAALSAATMPQAGAKRRWQRVPVALLVTLLCILGIGALVAFDPEHGRFSYDMLAKRVHHLAAASTATSHQLHAATLYAAKRAPAYAQQVALEGWHGVEAAAAAARQAVATAPAAAQHLWRHSIAVLAADVQAVTASSQRLATSIAACARHAAGWPAAWGCLVSLQTAVHAAQASMVDSLQTAASAASETLRQDWRRVSAAAASIVGHMPRSGADLAAVAVATGSAAQHAGVASVGAAKHHLQHARMWMARQLSTAPPPPPPAPPPSKTTASRVWTRITRRPPLHAAARAANPADRAGHKPAAATRKALPTQLQHAPAARAGVPAPAKAAFRLQKPPAPGVRSSPVAGSAKKIKLGRATTAAVEAATAAPAARQQRLAPHAAMPAGGGKGPAVVPKPLNTAAAAAGSTTKGDAVSPAGVRPPPLHSLPAAAGTAQPPPGQAAQAAVASSAAAVGCVAALAVFGLLAVAAWLRWLPGSRAMSQEQLGDAGEVEMYGGPDADEPDMLFEPLDMRNFPAAQPLALNPRRHTIATTRPQGREYAWLRPNEVVARPASASGGRGLDYLWLRSRVVVKLSPEIRSRVARSSTMKRLSQDISFRSPMGVLRNIDFAGRSGGGAARSSGVAAALEESPATPVSAGAAAARRASRRLTLG